MSGQHVSIPTLLDSHRRLCETAAPLTDETARRPSALPSWTRAHVVAHLVNNARAFTRMTRAALDGDLVPMYDGGVEGRNADIEAGAALPAATLLDALRSTADELEEAWAEVGADDWVRPVSYRGGSTVADTLDARWRENEIHAVDLDLGLACTAWSPDFSAHAVEFLLQRVPMGSGVALVPSDDARRWVVGDGSGPVVTGTLCDLAAWLAGRTTVGGLTVEGGTPGTGEPPDLGPWP